MAGRPASAPVDVAGRFAIPEVAPGIYDVSIAGRMCPECYVSGARQGGRDLAMYHLEVSGAEKTSIEVEVRDDAARLSGVVFDNLGQPLHNATVVAVPAADLRDRGGVYRLTNTDQSGQFSLRGLPPGDYTVLAWDNVEYGAWLDPQYLKSVEKHGTPVTLGAADRKQAPVAAIMTIAAQQRAAQ